MRFQWIGLWLAAVCILSIGSARAEVCGADELQHDVRNCGTCGNNCLTIGLNNLWQCRNGGCQQNGCQAGYYDIDANGTCEYACTFTSAQESCNNLDDDCDGQIDEDVIAPTPAQVCGVSPNATAAECTTNVGVACTSGAWTCTFPPNVCLGGSCASASEVCDALDNNCNGQLNENVPDFGDVCASDDGLATGHGRCRALGTRVCSSPTQTTCNAVPLNCATLPGGCTEFCDGIDNDCDAAIDETFNQPGTNSAFFVRPAVTQIEPNLWIFQYEASRPTGANNTQGIGNGYSTSAPAGMTFDRTTACSVADRLPWTEVTGQEASQTCTRMGGSVCSATQIETVCRSFTTTCNYGYSPRDVSCTTGFTATKYCNLGPSYDYASLVTGDQDGLLPTASPALANCAADWVGNFGSFINNTVTGPVFDLTGNIREIGQVVTNSFRGAGGSTWMRSEAGGQCLFAPAAFDQQNRASDLGFRCCFSSNPNP